MKRFAKATGLVLAFIAVLAVGVGGPMLLSRWVPWLPGACAALSAAAVPLGLVYWLAYSWLREREK